MHEEFYRWTLYTSLLIGHFFNRFHHILIEWYKPFAILREKSYDKHP